MFKFEKGDTVKDIITGFFGVITARADYMDNLVRYMVEWKDSTGRPVEWWFNEDRLEYYDMEKGE